MNHTKIDFARLSETLEMSCPFIGFALLQKPEARSWLHRSGHLELAVYTTTKISSCEAFESILPAFNDATQIAFCELILLNRVDPFTRIRALHGKCLFIRAGMEMKYREFVERTWLDLKVLRAHGRRKGMAAELLPDFNERSFYGSQNFLASRRIGR